MKDMSSQTPESEDEDEDNDDDENEDDEHESDARGPKPRMIPVVLFGSFEACIIKMRPENSTFDSEIPSILGFDYPEPNKVAAPQLPFLPIIRYLCDMLWCGSPRPNTVNGHPSPHPPLHFFIFILRKHFGCQFDELAFEMDLPEPVYYNFIRRGMVFTDEGEWEGMLTSLEPGQLLSKVGRGWSVYTHW